MDFDGFISTVSALERQRTSFDEIENSHGPGWDVGVECCETW